MKRFVGKIVIFLAIQAVIGSVYFHFFSRNNNRYLAATIDKHNRLESLGSPKIVFIGGSNLAFGLKSKLIEEELNLSAVNMALHAGLGIDFLINEIESDLNNGDVVIISYELTYVLTNVKPEIAVEVGIARPRNFRFFNWDWDIIKGFLDKSLPVLCAYLREYFIGHTNLDSIYSRANFNSYGDMTGHFEEEPREELSGNLDFEFTSNEEIAMALKRIADFAARSRSKGIEVLVSYPPIIDGFYEKSREGLMRYHAFLFEKLGDIVLEKPDDMVFPRKQFFDTTFHLSEEGAQIRTKKLIDRIKSFMGR